MTPADDETRALDKDLDWHRERRLKDAMDSETRPLIWKLKQADEIMQWSFVALIALDAATALLGHFVGFRPTLYILAFGVIAFRVLLAKTLWSWIVAGVDAYRERATQQPAVEKPAPTKEDILPAPDTFEGLAIDELAHDIAFSGQEKITREALHIFGITRKRGADQFQHILRKSEFLLYALGASPAAYPIGAERIADKRRDLNMAVALHPTLMSSTAEDRSVVIANALRRALGFSADADPQIQGEPSPACRMVSPAERVPREIAA